MPESPQRILVVGVMAMQPDAVVTQAASLARQLGARLVCASVDAGRYVVEEAPDGSIRSAPLDPDLAEVELTPDEPDRLDAALEGRLRELLDPTGVAWETRALAGDPARALARLAETLDAMMIIVGTHEGGLRGTLRELFNGSVAAHLAHRQHRPVVVIPLSPVGLDAALPWESDS
jgi:nucleotide-binding universal stress UspA family protein